MRIVDASGRDLCICLKAAIDSSWEPCRVHSGDSEVVPVAIITVEYETDVVVDGERGSMVIVFLFSFRAVAVPSTSVNFSAE